MSALTMRVSVAEQARLSVLIGRRAFRTFLGRINAHPLLRWRFVSTKTDRLVIAPQDLRTADATRASEIYAGRFAFAGKVVISDRRSPFDMTPPSDEWAARCSVSSGCGTCAPLTPPLLAPMPAR
jgi:uncharacterized heparinase superfamily protein